MKHRPASSHDSSPPSLRRVLIGLAAAAAAGAALLVTVVLPAEYGIDPTGIGGALGLTALGDQGSRTVEIVDVIGGNDVLREVEVPDHGEPVPLPNPAIHQDAERPARSETLEIALEPGGQTEIKAQLAARRVVTYSWSVDRGPIYSDFHGHDPAAGDDLWVRYREHDASDGASGSLVAPFDGEHGWFWLNYNEHPVVITLQLHGFHDGTVDYGTW